MNKKNGQFNPDYVVPPGETLLETLEHFGMSQSEFAERTGRPKKTINEIIRGKAAITTETALQFERVLGVSANFWNNLEYNYREKLAVLEEKQRLSDQIKWLEKIPFKPMIKLGWIRQCEEKIQQLQEVLNFFGVASIQAWEDVWERIFNGCEVAYRQSCIYESDAASVASWLRQGEIVAQNSSCKPFNLSAFRNALGMIRHLTNESPEVFVPELKKVCSGVGVAVVFIPELPGMRINGATRWLSPNKALIQLSLRYKTNDHLWFTFFHEAGHIVLHGKKDLFVENHVNITEKEIEADKFAADHLIPISLFNEFIRAGNFSSVRVNAFAEKVGIAPGIVVGRLQHEKLVPFTNLNGLKRSFQWSK